jgi:hypothetical protein
VSPALRAEPPAFAWDARTTASAEKAAYKEQVRSAPGAASELPAGPVHVQIAFTVSPRRNWMNLWKPTIDVLDPLLGRTRPDRNCHPRDGRITDLGLHLTKDATLGNDISISITAAPADAPADAGIERAEPVRPTTNSHG